MRNSERRNLFLKKIDFAGTFFSTVSKFSIPIVSRAASAFRSSLWGLFYREISHLAHNLLSLFGQNEINQFLYFASRLVPQIPE